MQAQVGKAARHGHEQKRRGDKDRPSLNLRENVMLRRQ
jgi:hypothetical protein